MNEDTMERDERLGAALRELDVPEHGPGFFDELDRRLAGRRGAPARRAPGRPRRGLRIATAVGVAAVAVGVLAVLGDERAPRIVGPEVATAAEIRAQVRTSLASLRSLSGMLVEEVPNRGVVRRWRFALTAEGDLRLAGPGEGEVITYDAANGVVRSAQRSASLGGGPLFYAERRGVAPGPPDAGRPALLPIDELGAFAQALLAADDPRVREISYDGRPAWQVDIEVVPNAIVPELSADRLELTVSRESALPVRVVERRRGVFLRELRVEELAVDPVLGPETFRLRFPRGAEVMRGDDGFRRVSLGEVAEHAGYPPLVPAWVPTGYRLAEIAIASDARPTGAEAGNPLSRNVVSLSYRRGLDQFLVTTRLAGRHDWGDPLATGEGFVDRPEPTALGGGALRGVRAELAIAPRGIPHVWAVTDQLVVTVGGDLGRAELVRVAESLVER